MSTKSTLLTCIICLLFTALSIAQTQEVTLSGLIKDKQSNALLHYVNVVVKSASDGAFISGTVTDETGRYTLTKLQPGNYTLESSYTGYTSVLQRLYIGNLSQNMEWPTVELKPASTAIAEVSVTAVSTGIDRKMDKKTYALADNLSQTGGSVLQSMQNLPGVTVQEGKVQLRGSDKITVLIDGKQTALTGFGSQSGLDNIPASAIDKIEIINNPSSKFDANGNAGIINIIMKKEKQEGWNGKVGLSAGLGSLWIRKENLPTIRPQYTATPKINPSVSLNYRKNKINVFVQADNLYTETLNKNEFATRNYDDGTSIQSQLKRNRNTNFLTSKAGIDWTPNEHNTFTFSGLFGSEKIIDRGDQPFFNADMSQRIRLWQFLEDELKTTVMGTASYQHRFKEPGHLINAGINYTFHREDEQYFYDNYLPASTGTDAFKLLSDEQVYDINVDYVKPLKYGRLETGLKLRNRSIPTDMTFIPGANSVLDRNAGGWANYSELIPAIYGNYTLETEKWEAELGLRLEYVRIQYDVNPDHSTYKSDG